MVVWAEVFVEQQLTTLTMASVNLSVKGMLAALNNQEITVAPIATKNQYGVKMWQFMAGGQQFCLKTDEAPSGGYTDKFPSLNVGATPRMETLVEMMSKVVERAEDIGAVTNEPVQTGAWFAGPFFKIAYDEDNDQVMEVDGSGPPEPVPWSSIQKGDKMMLVIAPRIWKKGNDVGIKFWTRHARIVERGDGGNDAFAAVDDWEPGTRLDQMARQGPASKKMKLDYVADDTANAASDESGSDMATSPASDASASLSPPALTRAVSVAVDDIALTAGA